MKFLLYSFLMKVYHGQDFPQYKSTPGAITDTIKVEDYSYVFTPYRFFSISTEANR